MAVGPYPSEQMVSQQMEDLPMPWWADAIGDIPGIPTVAAVNAGRTANTMLYGARGGGGKVGQIGGMFSQNWNPKNIFRYSTDEFITNPGTKTGYTPYLGSRAVNWVGKKAYARKSKAAAKAGESVGGVLGSSKGHLMHEGFLGRITAASKLENMSAARYSKMAEAGKFKFLGMGGAEASSMGTAGVASRAALMTTTGGWTGRMAGYLEGAKQYGKTGRVASSATRHRMLAMGQKPTEAAMQGLKAAGRHAGLAAKGGLKGGAATAALTGSRLLLKGATYATPIGYLMLAYDAGKLTSKAVGYTAKLAGEAFESGFSGLNTQVGGAMFKDTEASLTSRSRGVMAIQNSRMNARSILGSEAASMSSYYG